MYVSVGFPSFGAARDEFRDRRFADLFSTGLFERCVSQYEGIAGLGQYKKIEEPAL